MFRAALFIIAKKWGDKTPNVHELTNEKQMQCLHTMAYYYSGKRNDSLTPATMWVNPENIC